MNTASPNKRDIRVTSFRYTLRFVCVRTTPPQVPSPNMHNAGDQCTVSDEIHAKQLHIMVPL
jgi:hypothetical protein